MATKKTSGTLLRWLAVALAIVLFDQFTKALIVGYFELGESRTVASFFNVVYVLNTGAAFNFLANAAGWQRWFFIGLGSAAALFIVWMLSRHGGQRVFGWGLSLILGGAIGNVIDRVARGSVVDFIQVHYAGWYFPAFNVADSAITIGAGLLILDELLRVRRAR